MNNKREVGERVRDELLPCPFCGDDAKRAVCCGKAKPNCPDCSDLFGCHRCDVWMDTAEQWNTRAASSELAAAREEVEGLRDEVEKLREFERAVDEQFANADEPQYLGGVKFIFDEKGQHWTFEASDGREFGYFERLSDAWHDGVIYEANADD